MLSRCLVHIKCPIGGSCYHSQSTYQPQDGHQDILLVPLNILVLGDIFTRKMNNKKKKEILSFTKLHTA